MSTVQLEREAPTPREPAHMRSLQPERSDKGGQAVGPVGQAERLGRRIRRRPRARRVPRHDRELVGEPVELTAPLAAVHGPSMEENERRSHSLLPVRDPLTPDFDFIHTWRFTSLGRASNPAKSVRSSHRAARSKRFRLSWPFAADGLTPERTLVQFLAEMLRQGFRIARNTGRGQSKRNSVERDVRVQPEDVRRIVGPPPPRGPPNRSSTCLWIRRPRFLRLLRAPWGWRRRLPDLKAPSTAPYPSQTRVRASSFDRKSRDLRGFCRALFRTRTGDPLL